MKNLKRLSRTELKDLIGGAGGVKCEQMRAAIGCTDPNDSDGAQGCKECVSCSNRQGSESCYTDPNGDCTKARQMARSLC